MTFLEKLRKRWESKPRGHVEEEAEQVAAEARGEAYTLQEHKDAVRNDRAESDFPSRGAGQVLR